MFSLSLTIFKVPKSFTLETIVEIKPQLNTALSGLYISKNIYCTQCEAHGFRRITYYIDRPDVMALFNDLHRLGMTILIATHDLPLIATMKHRIVALKRGKIC